MMETAGAAAAAAVESRVRWRPCTFFDGGPLLNCFNFETGITKKNRLTILKSQNVDDWNRLGRSGKHSRRLKNYRRGRIIAEATIHRLQFRARSGVFVTMLSSPLE